MAPAIIVFIILLHFILRARHLDPHFAPYDFLPFYHLLPWSILHPTCMPTLRCWSLRTRLWTSPWCWKWKAGRGAAALPRFSWGNPPTIINGIRQSSLVLLYFYKLPFEILHFKSRCWIPFPLMNSPPAPARVSHLCHTLCTSILFVSINNHPSRWTMDKSGRFCPMHCTYLALDVEGRCVRLALSLLLCFRVAIQSHYSQYSYLLFGN